MLTPNQMTILKLMASCSNKEIAKRLGISCYTVKNIITTIMRKRHWSTRTQAVMDALRDGTLQLGEIEDVHRKEEL